MARTTTRSENQSKFRAGVCDFQARSYTSEELSVRLVATLAAPKVETFIRNMYFEGGDILVCKSGRFFFGFRGEESVELSPGEALLVYPGNVVTIRSLKAGGQLNYVIFNGKKVAEYLNSFGFYDKLHFKVDVLDETFKTILHEVETGTRPEVVLSYITDAMTTFQQMLRREQGAVLNDAVRVIHENLAKGIVGIKPVCDVLNVSRSYLNGLFVRKGLGNPAVFIRREQLAIACRLLQTTDLSVVEIGKSVGIQSPVYFSSFMRRLTGRTPTEIRADNR